jgi:hypothetical protein
MLDTTVALTWIAAYTKRERLRSGIIVLPLRSSVLLAKELASVDVVSGGRLIVGVGAGWPWPEYEALGVPMEEAGANGRRSARDAGAVDERASRISRIVLVVQQGGGVSASGAASDAANWHWWRESGGVAAPRGPCSPWSVYVSDHTLNFTAVITLSTHS